VLTDRVKSRGPPVSCTESDPELQNGFGISGVLYDTWVVVTVWDRAGSNSIEVASTIASAIVVGPPSGMGTSRSSSSGRTSPRESRRGWRIPPPKPARPRYRTSIGPRRS
jgi:hypothetical protein